MTTDNSPQKPHPRHHLDPVDERSLPAGPRARLTAEDVSVTRAGSTIFHHLNMTVSPGSRWGVVGENGRGKSTLLHVLAGTLAPSWGRVQRVGTIGLAEQELPGSDGATVANLIETELAGAHAALDRLDRAALALADGYSTDRHSDNGGQSPAERAYTEAVADAEARDAWDADRRVDTALAALNAETDRSRLLSTLSVGQRHRVRLAALLGADHDMLLLDEPTNHLDQAGLTFLTESLRSRAGGVVIVSHDRALLTDLVEQIIDLDPTEDGLPAVSGGGFAGYREERARARARWEAEYERQVAEYSRLTADLEAAQARLHTGWRPDKGTGKHQRQSRAPGIVQTVNRRREEVERRTPTVPPPPMPFRMPQLPVLRHPILIDVDDVSVSGRLAPVSLRVRSGSRLLVHGPNGAGKSTLLRLADGDLAPQAGAVTHADDARIALLAQETRENVGADASKHADVRRRTAGEVYRQSVEMLLARGVIAEGDALALDELGLLSAADAETPVGALSSGGRRRLDLALTLARRPHVLLLDEPTNHLSIPLVEQLTQALRDTPAAVVVATHDRQLLRDLDDWPTLRLDPAG